MYIVGFNGPPRSGKDTLAEMLANQMDKAGVVSLVVPESLSLPLREIAYAMTGWQGARDGFTYEAFKTEVFPQFGNRTGRQLMIDVSERFLKAIYGQTIMADLLIARNSGIGSAVLLIRDCGFQCEVNPLESWVGVENLYMVNLFREGCDFSNDSREYVHTSGKMHQVYNDSDLAHLETEAGRIYGRLVNQCGWKL